jgi:hypothetical protein
MKKSQGGIKLPLNQIREFSVKQECKKLFEQVQKLLQTVGASGLMARGLEFSRIDNNPRHGRVSLGQLGTVEVVQRFGQWWVMPQRS